MRAISPRFGPALRREGFVKEAECRAQREGEPWEYAGCLSNSESEQKTNVSSAVPTKKNAW